MQNFDDYQVELFKKFEKFRPKYTGCSYPPYHVGMYLEEYFFFEFLKRGKQAGQYLIPVFWTNCYLQNETAGLQELLDELNPDFEYFCVSQHDDAIKENLPPKTLHFNAGGNKNGIPIPLVCSPITDKPKVDKKVFCSFIASMTHPIRQNLVYSLINKSGFELYGREWTQKIEDAAKDFFINKTSESLFSLCPRGYGATSFRFYEAMQLGTVPVFVYNKDWFPYEDIIDWDSFSVRVHVSEIDNIQNILIEKAPFTQKMSETGRLFYDKFFSLEALPDQIYRILNAQ